MTRQRRALVGGGRGGEPGRRPTRASTARCEPIAPLRRATTIEPGRRHHLQRARTWRKWLGDVCWRAASSRRRSRLSRERDRDASSGSLVTPMPHRPSRRRSWTRHAAQLPRYALGLSVRDYRGRKRPHATPAACPATSPRCCWMPDATARRSRCSPTRSRARAFDAIALLAPRRAICGAPRHRLVRRVTSAPSAADASKRPSRASAGTAARATDVDAPRCRSTSYAGTYRDAWYGDVDLALEDGQPGDALHPHARACRATSSTGSTTPSSRAGATASSAPTPSSPSRSTQTAASTRSKMRAGLHRRPTSASTSRTCCWSGCPDALRSSPRRAWPSLAAPIVLTLITVAVARPQRLAALGRPGGHGRSSTAARTGSASGPRAAAAAAASATWCSPADASALASACSR